MQKLNKKQKKEHQEKENQHKIGGTVANRIQIINNKGTLNCSNRIHI